MHPKVIIHSCHPCIKKILSLYRYESECQQELDHTVNWELDEARVTQLLMDKITLQGTMEMATD